MSGPAPRDVLGASGIAFVVGAVAPRLAYRLRWPSRLRGRGLVIYIAAQAGVIFGVRYWLAPQLRRAAADRTTGSSDSYYDGAPEQLAPLALEIEVDGEPPARLDLDAVPDD
jgi:hypothetical protein